MAKKLILLRHGESQWNLENRFTGWTDVDLTEKGEAEAKQAGQLLLAQGFTPDCAFTSVQKRAIRTLWLALETLDRVWIPVVKDWHLNERHYGALQGLNKAETAAKYGDEQVHVWRRSFDTPPPPLEKDDKRYPGFEPKYANLKEEELPLTESLKLTIDRVVPYWNDVIVPEIKADKQVLIAAHGNSLRALVKHLKGISEEDIPSLNIPTGVPLIFELDDNLKPTADYYLGDQDAIAAKAAAVAKQGASAATA